MFLWRFLRCFGQNVSRIAIQLKCNKINMQPWLHVFEYLNQSSNVSLKQLYFDISRKLSPNICQNFDLAKQPFVNVEEVWA